MVSVLQIHVTQSPGDILVFLTGQVSLQDQHYKADLLSYAVFLLCFYMKKNLLLCIVGGDRGVL